MNQQRRGLVRALTPWVVVFGIGVGVGFYVRDRQQHERLQEAVESAREQMEEAGLKAIDRARRAGADSPQGLKRQPKAPRRRSGASCEVHQRTDGQPMAYGQVRGCVVNNSGLQQRAREQFPDLTVRLYQRPRDGMT